MTDPFSRNRSKFGENPAPDSISSQELAYIESVHSYDGVNPSLGDLFMGA